jgi:hypothetical protein
LLSLVPVYQSIYCFICNSQEELGGPVADLDDILYWNDDSFLDETLPYYDESEDDCLGNTPEYFNFISSITLFVYYFSMIFTYTY